MTVAAGGASSSRVRVDTPVQVLSRTENLVTQWKSAPTSVRGRSPNCGQVQRVTSPLAVSPKTLKSHVSGFHAGTGP